MRSRLWPLIAALQFNFHAALVPSWTTNAVHRRYSASSLGSTVIPIESSNQVDWNEASNDQGTTSVSSWHRERRRQMILKYGAQIAPLEREASSQAIGLPLLVLSCSSLWGLAVLCGSLPIWAVVLLAIFPGSMFSLWQLQILHDVIHGSFFKKDQLSVWGIPRKQCQDLVLFVGSLPSIFGYYLYLKFGHLTHHKNTGQHDLATLFASDAPTFEDGDVLFVAHRMNLKGDYGPTIPLPGGKQVKLSISKSGFYFWKDGEALLNACRFAASFLYERVLLCVNDAFVALLGQNLFFPNKPPSFQKECTTYARVATALRALLYFAVGWKALLFLFLSETLWSLPPHPACAMFVSNHGSTMNGHECIPTSSTYTGAWYSLFTLGTNFHCEHHDFPTIPFHRLHELRTIAPEFYRRGSSDDLVQIMTKTFAHPEFYACMNSNAMADSQSVQVQS